MSYGDVHRFLLRTVASQGVLTLSVAQDILDRSFPDRDRTQLKVLVKEINDQISPFNQKIKIVIDEVTTEENVVFLSLGFDNATKSQTMFTAKELDFFRALIEEIMTTESRQITSEYALNLVNKLHLSKTDAQRLLNTWCRMHYLVETNSNYALGLRAIHEFEHYLRENLPGSINGCCLCNEFVFRGYNCPMCEEAVHTRCLNVYLKARSIWPCCKADFNKDQLEMLHQEGVPLTQPVNTSHTINETQPTQRSSTMVESLQESDDEFEQTIGTPIPGVSQRVSRKRKRMSRN